jgi:putative addiction module component (TIGR02574 family)
MTRAADSIIEAAMTLPPAERAEIVTELIRTLDGPTPEASEQADIDAVWQDEIRRRMRLIKQGRAQWIDGERVMEKLRPSAADSDAGHTRP